MAIPIDLVTWTVPRPRRTAWRYDGAMTAPTSLPFTGDPEADNLIATEPLALLIGFALDQQVTVQKAFSGPRDIKRRLGHLDAAKIAAMPPDALDAVFREQPAIHRFPGSMAGKVQSLCAAIASDYGNDAARVWEDASDGKDLERRLLGAAGDRRDEGQGADRRARQAVRCSAAGYEDVAPTWPTLGDVDSAEALASYQATKRAHKAEMRAARQALNGRTIDGPMPRPRDRTRGVAAEPGIEPAPHGPSQGPDQRGSCRDGADRHR